MPYEVFPIGPVLEDSFEVSNFSSQRLRIKIERTASSDFQLSFNSYSAVIEPVY